MNVYSYETQKKDLFTDAGSIVFTSIRDNVRNLLKKAGAVRMLEATQGGSSWPAMACVDRLVELGEIREITDGKVAGQHRVFVDVKLTQ